MTAFRDLSILLPGTELRAWVRYITRVRDYESGPIRRAYWTFLEPALEPILSVIPGADAEIENQCLADDEARRSIEYDAEADSVGSYYAAMEEIGRRVKSGEEPPPTTGYFGPRKNGRIVR